MNTVTFSPAALAQIKTSTQETGADNMGLRIAASMASDKSVDYGLGFDEIKKDDIQFEYDGISILIAPDSEEILHGAHIDFVEIEPGKFHFIFLNPNDPNFKPPTE